MKPTGFEQSLLLFFFFLTDKPVLKRDPLTSKSAADSGETAALVCEAEGVPNVTFAWARVGGAFIKTKEEHFHHQDDDDEEEEEKRTNNRLRKYR